MHADWGFWDVHKQDVTDHVTAEAPRAGQQHPDPTRFCFVFRGGSRTGRVLAPDSERAQPGRACWSRSQNKLITEPLRILRGREGGQRGGVGGVGGLGGGSLKRVGWVGAV